MITRLALRNWRAYEAVNIKLDPGTTFVVARNGIGKTSLIEGATWALFGDAGGRPRGAVRVGTSVASATVEVSLPDGRSLTITRELPKKLAKARQAPMSAALDGKALTAAEVEATVREAFGGDPAFLAQLTMLRGSEHLDGGAPDLNLREHLNRFFGVEGLQETLDELVARGKEIEARIRQIKQVVGVSPRQLRTLKAEHEEALRLAHEAEIADLRAQEALKISAELKRKAEAFLSWQREEQERIARMGELADRVAHFARGPVAAEQLQTILDGLEITTSEELEFLRRQRGQLEGRIDAVSSALEELETATGTCPVCRRPLSEEDANEARIAHEAELSAMQRELGELDESELLHRLQSIREFRRELESLSRAREARAKPGISVEEAETRLAVAEQEAEGLRSSVIERKAEALAAASALDRAESDLRSSDLLESEFRSLGFVSAAGQAVSATVDALLADIIDPLERAIASRWKRLFGNRGSLKLSGRGVPFRELSGEPLDFESFSTGEKVGAQLILRLLVLETATRATFCWVDEPLEHLDLDARRQMASLVAALPATTRLDQMLVTTYEEPLARRLSNRRPGEVRLVYVRPEGDITDW